MKKYLLTLLLIILGIAVAFAQKGSDSTYYCGTINPTVQEMERLPWYGNNQFLYNFSYIKKK